jgi:hypothetical protein
VSSFGTVHAIGAAHAEQNRDFPGTGFPSTPGAAIRTRRDGGRETRRARAWSCGGDAACHDKLPKVTGGAAKAIGRCPAEQKRTKAAWLCARFGLSDGGGGRS